MHVAPHLLSVTCLLVLLPFSATFIGRPAVSAPSSGLSTRHDGRESRTQLLATAAPIARKKKGAGLVKRAPPPSVKVTKLRKGERYRGYINPKLKALVEAPEYRKVIDLLAQLENETKLDYLLSNAQVYWRGLNIWEMSKIEKEQGRQAVAKIIRRDWPRIWPKELEDSRVEAYEVFSAFYRRVEQSQIIDTLVTEVLPDIKKPNLGPKELQNSDRLLVMSDLARWNEFQNRFNDSATADQYRILAENDTAIPVLSQKLLPFFAAGMDNFEYKLQHEPMTMPSAANWFVGISIGLGFVLVLAISGAIQLPSMEERYTLERTQERIPMVVSTIPK